MLRKGKCFLSQITGKRETTRYDLEGVNVKQAPTNGEQVEMSVLQEEGSVNHAFEGQRNTFRRTDAAMAWMQNWDGSAVILQGSRTFYKPYVILVITE